MTANVLGRVVEIRSGAATCSAFTIEVDTKQYLVTARHCTKGVTNAKQIDVRLGDVWQPLEGQIILPTNPDVDIAAIPLPRARTITYEFEPTSSGMTVGQPVYFLGYPSGLSTKRNSAGTRDSFDVAFVKAGILSAVDSRNHDAVVIYVDGLNNPGFSGGPIVFRPKPDAPFRVAGVVSGYKGEGTPVLKRKDLTDSSAPAFKELYVRANAGIVFGYDIVHIVKAITASVRPNE
jgi:hypothetical protein